jgi:hypothetical protein
VVVLKGKYEVAGTKAQLNPAINKSVATAMVNLLENVDWLLYNDGIILPS